MKETHLTALITGERSKEVFQSFAANDNEHLKLSSGNNEQNHSSLCISSA